MKRFAAHLKFFNFLFLFLIPFTFFILATFTATTVSAQAEDLLGPEDINLHTWTGANSLDLVAALNCQLIGVDPTQPGGTGCINYKDGLLVRSNKVGDGAVVFMGNLIGQLYQPPASTSQYIAYLKGNLGLATPAYAQGTGWTGLSPILPLWRNFRDAAYFFFAFFFVIVGLLIMFRIRVSPQAVATLQNSLPRLLITLILITLSYAIVGLMIDLMYVLMLLLGAFFQNLGGGINVPNAREAFGQNVIVYFLGGRGLGKAPIDAAAAMIGGVVNALTGGLGPLAGGLAYGLAWAIFAIAVLWALFRLFLILLKAYVWVIVLLIFAPLQLLLGALPGTGATFGFSGWIRGLLANLAVFPATLVMMLLASALVQIAARSPGAGWVAPFLGAGWGPGQLPSLIALGIILMSPHVAQMMNDAFKPPPFPYGAALGAALGAGAGVYTGAARRGFAYMEKMPEIGKKRGISGFLRG